MLVECPLSVCLKRDPVVTVTDSEGDELLDIVVSEGLDDFDFRFP